MEPDDIYEVANSIIKNHESVDPDPYRISGISEKWIPRPLLGQEFKQYFRPGVYIASGRMAHGESIPNPVQLKEEEDLYDFPCEGRGQVRKAIREFWESKHSNRREGVAFRTGIAIHGPPGSGKSMLLKQEIRRLVAEGQVVFLVDSPWPMKESIARFRAYEPDRGLTVVIEDIDEIIKSYGEQVFLETMGGLESAENILFLATTNNLEEMSAKLKRRGRFDLKIEVKLPNIKQRFIYLSEKISGRESVGRIKKLAKLTEGFSFGDLRDLHRSVYVYGRSLRESIVGIKQEITTS